MENEKKEQEWEELLLLFKKHNVNSELIRSGLLKIISTTLYDANTRHRVTNLNNEQLLNLFNEAKSLVL